LVELQLEPARGRSESILVVEDDDAVRSTAASLLRSRIHRSASALSAMAVTDSGVGLDLLFTDVVMPGTMRRPELAEKARERIPNLAVLFTSGSNGNAMVHAGRLDEGVELLSKPYTQEGLARKVRQVLGAQAPVTASEQAFPERSTLRIPFCEDDDLIRATVKDLLELPGYVVADVASANEALASFAQQTFDLLITDVGLSKSSGAELAQTLRQLKPNLSVIFATGRLADASSVSSERTLTLLKPFGAAQLASAIAPVMDGADDP